MVKRGGLTMTESKEETGAMTENKHRQTFAVLGPILVVFSLIAGAYIGTVNQVRPGLLSSFVGKHLKCLFWSRAGDGSPTTRLPCLLPLSPWRATLP